MGKGGKKARRAERPESEICELLVRAEAEGRAPVADACRERAERLAGKLAVAGGREDFSLDIFPPAGEAAWTVGDLVLATAEAWLCAGCEPAEPFLDLPLVPLSRTGWAATSALYAMEAGGAFAAWMEYQTEGGRR